MFPKPKGKKLSKKVAEKSTTTLTSTIDSSKKNVSENIVIDDSKPSGPEETYWHQLCGTPRIPGQIGDTIITKHDYASLRPQAYVTDSVVNWWLRLLSLKYGSNKDLDVAILNTEFYEKLKNWTPTRTDLTTSLKNWTNQYNFWQGKCRFVLVPVCWQSHYYLLVNVLDTEKPMTFILESIGSGHFAAIPPYTKILGSFLSSLRDKSPQQIKFREVLIKVPRQPDYSNDCASFLLHYTELILKDPFLFEAGAALNSLEDWFESSDVENMRETLASYISDEGLAQRQPGGFLEGQVLDLTFPLVSPHLVHQQVSEHLQDCSVLE